MSISILILHGNAALSDFRLKKLSADIFDNTGIKSGVKARYVHFASIQKTLSENEQQQLESLLDYGEPASIANESNALKIFAIPRVGTISPWSSKASDIVHNCGLTKVHRVERGIEWSLETDMAGFQSCQNKILPLLHDRMIEEIILDLEQASLLFQQTRPRELGHIDIMTTGRPALVQANHNLGLALSDIEIDYLLENYQLLQRNPTDVELMMFAQANSEHCRHKIFNSSWTIDQKDKDLSLFDMIRKTHDKNPGRVLSAYSDNAAVTKGYHSHRFYPDPESKCYKRVEEDVNILMKVETHNHPTAISPLPGAATGSGGEIRDEAATGRGGKPKAGLTGFSVSNLNIPEFTQAWEIDYGKPGRIVSALDIMIEGPIGGAAFNNEFGRPNLCGYFRTFEQTDTNGIVRGYHKPIMIAGGYGSIRSNHVKKESIPEGAKLIVLGGPAMLIGLGGGAASSMSSGSSQEALDFASVQRHNPEIQRRCQEVIDQCWALGDKNPIVSIHDVGAGGLSNALPELVSDSDRGAIFDLRAIPNDEPGMSPMEIWCNESQERYVLAIQEKELARFESLCKRERAPYAVIGEAKQKQQLVLQDSHFNNKPIDIPMSVLLGKLPRTHRDVESTEMHASSFDVDSIDLNEAVNRLLHLPTIADKRFLITIGDRSVGGLVCRDQMVGPWQIPVADCAITASGFGEVTGEAMSMGEKPTLALINPAASARMAVAEAITNISAARIATISDISLSANWMAACNTEGEDAKLYEAVSAVSDFCQQLGICIPVGKDSLSMNTHWQDDTEKKVRSPLSLIVTAFSPVIDIHQNLTPQLSSEEETSLLLIDLGTGKNRLGGSCLTQVFNSVCEDTPDINDISLLKAFFKSIQILNESGLIDSYHDRSDGGVITTLIEMALCGRVGLDIELPEELNNPIEFLFNEEIGAVIQVKNKDVNLVINTFENNYPGSSSFIYKIGRPGLDKTFSILCSNKVLINEPLCDLQHKWSSTSTQIQMLRDNPECARSEHRSICDMENRGLFFDKKFNDELLAPYINIHRPKVAILREQGVNGHIEMAAAFDKAGFETVDVHMTDLINKNTILSEFSGMAVCGGFSYGDVLGAGGGWARSILFNDYLKEIFENFFNNKNTFTLAVCNGCQMLSQLKEIIPGAENWPAFTSNLSEQFEARLVMAKVKQSPSILLRDMDESAFPIVVAHGEGRAVFEDKSNILDDNICLQYVDDSCNPTVAYPDNPNGSIAGITGLTNNDGRVTIMMPHPERVFLESQFSWRDSEWSNDLAPWFAIFNNARKWLN